MMRFTPFLMLLCAACPPRSPEHTATYADDPWLACRFEERGVLKGLPEIASTDNREPAVAGQMTEEAAQAKRLFNNERWPEAREYMLRVVNGHTGDDEGNRQIAEYHVAICSYRMKDYRAALNSFALISSDPLHLKHSETLLWLAKLATFPETSVDAIDLMVRYDDALIQRFDNPQQRDLLHLIYFGIGRAWYRRGDNARAAASLDRIPPASPAASLARDCRALLR